MVEASRTFLSTRNLLSGDEGAIPKRRAVNTIGNVQECSAEKRSIVGAGAEGEGAKPKRTATTRAKRLRN